MALKTEHCAAFVFPELISSDYYTVMHCGVSIMQKVSTLASD